MISLSINSDLHHPSKKPEKSNQKHLSFDKKPLYMCWYYSVPIFSIVKSKKACAGGVKDLFFNNTTPK